MKRHVLGSIGGILILITGCSFPHYYYIPNTQNVPLFKEKNIFSGHVAGSIGEVNNCLEVQAGYSLPGHVALTANYMIGGNNHSSDTYNDYDRIQYFEGAIGFYQQFKNAGVFEIYGGYGHGWQHHAFAYSIYDNWFSWNVEPDGNADLSLSKVFIQPDIGIKAQWVEGILSCRLSRLNFNEITIYNTVHHLDELNIIRQYSTPWLLEPAITFRGGPKIIKAEVQLGYSINLTNTEMMFEKYSLTFGLQFNLATRQPKD
jgi:hypothetical protein